MYMHINIRHAIFHLGMTRPEPGVPRLSHAAAPPDKDLRLGIKTISSMAVSEFIENGLCDTYNFNILAYTSPIEYVWTYIA